MNETTTTTNRTAPHRTFSDVMAGIMLLALVLLAGCSEPKSYSYSQESLDEYLNACSQDMHPKTCECIFTTAPQYIPESEFETFLRAVAALEKEPTELSEKYSAAFAGIISKCLIHIFKEAL